MDINDSLERLSPPFNSFAQKLKCVAVSADLARRATSKKAMEAFIERLDCDFEGFKEFLRGRMEEVRRLVTEVIPSNEDNNLAADYLANELRSIEAFSRLYVESLRKITQLALPDSTPTGLAFIIHARGERVQKRFLTEGQEVARRLNLALFPPHTEIRANSRFERDSSKFWLPPEELFGLQVICGLHLPLDVFLASANVDKVRVSSIYFDTIRLNHYTERVRRQEGSTLIRLRAYGVCPQEVWVEMKTHHESWVQNQSIKERFRLPFNRVHDFLNGSVSVESLLSESTEHVKNIASGIQSKISSKLLVPVVRTDYYRTAYQSDSQTGQFIRVTIDSHLTVVDLRNYSVEKALQAFSNAEPDTNEKMAPFPFAVIETKVHGLEGGANSNSAWLEQVLAPARSAECFSKYQLGIASFVPHHQLCQPPVWWANLQKLGEKRKIKDKDSKAPALPHWNVSSPAPVESVKSFSTPSRYVAPPAEVEPPPPEDNNLARTVAGLPGIRVPQFLLPTALPDSSTAGMSMKIEPKTHFANERTFIQWHSAALFLCTVAKLTGRSYHYFPFVQVLFLLSLFIMFYSLWRYHWRRLALQQRLIQRFDDPFGPTLMTGALTIAIFALFADSFNPSMQTILDVNSSPDSLGPKQWSHLVDGEVQGVIYQKMNHTVFLAYHDTPTVFLGPIAVPVGSSKSYLAKFDTKSGFMQRSDVTDLLPALIGGLDWSDNKFMLGTKDGSLIELQDPFTRSAIEYHHEEIEPEAAEPNQEQPLVIWTGTRKIPSSATDNASNSTLPLIEEIVTA